MNENAISAFYHLYLSEEPMTTGEVAERVFEPEGTDEERNAERKVRYYFEDGYEHLTAVSERGGTKRYDIRDDRIWFGMGQMRVITVEGEEVTTGFGDVLVYITDEGEPEVVSIEYGEGEETYDPEERLLETDF